MIKMGICFGHKNELEVIFNRIFNVQHVNKGYKKGCGLAFGEQCIGKHWH